MRGVERRTLPVGLTGGKACRSESWVGGSPPPRYRRLVAAGPALAQSDTLASVKQKGKIVVGVKADYKPFGYTDPSGKIVGLEVDLAQRRREAPRRAGRARSGRRGEPDGVPEAGADRPHDRDDGLQARSRRGRRHSGAVLLRGRSERLRQEELGTQELDRSQGQADLRDPGRVLQPPRPARSSARSSPCSRA